MTPRPVPEEVSPAELLALIGRETDGSDVTDEELAALLAAGHDEVTTARVAAWVARARKKAKKVLGLGDVPAEVLVRPAHRGRVTGYSLTCLGCGLVAPRLAASKRLGALAAAGHLRADHDGAGEIAVL